MPLSLSLSLSLSLGLDKQARVTSRELFISFSSDSRLGCSFSSWQSVLSRPRSLSVASRTQDFRVAYAPLCPPAPMPQVGFTKLLDLY